MHEPSLPWRILVAPVTTWRGLLGQQRSWRFAVLWIALGSLAGHLISAQALLEIDSAARHIAFTVRALPSAIILTALSSLLGTLLGWLALSIVIFALAVFIGHKLRLSICLNLASLALIPFILGDILGHITLALARPLSADLAGAWCAHLRPYSFGLATLVPAYALPLSIQWYFAAYFDLFGLWSLLILALGLRYYAKLDWQRIFWLTLGLVLLCSVALAGLWQVIQRLMLQAS